MNAILLATRHCQQRASLLSEAEINQHLAALGGWARDDGHISKTFRFPDHYQLMAFVNALAWVSHRANHHADIAYSYNTCTVRYSTHDAGGITENDFICAAKVDILQAI